MNDNMTGGTSFLATIRDVFSWRFVVANAAFLVVTCLFFAWGFITSNTDPLIAAMRGIYTLNVAEGMLTQFAFFLAYFVVSLPAAALLARLGHSRTIITALMVMVGACVLMLVASHIQVYEMVLVALFVMASGITVLQVAANPLAASLGAPERSHFRLTFAQAFNSLGVVLGVQIGSKLMLRDDVFGQGGHILPDVSRATALGAIDHAFVLIAVGIAALALLIYAFRKRINTSAADITIQGASGLAALGSGWAVFGAVAIFLYVGAEVTIASIMINFLNQGEVLGLPLQTAGFYLALIYWGGAMIGRFIGSALLPWVRASYLLTAAAIAAAALSAAAFLLHGPAAAYAALSVGFFNSIMFPTIFSITMERSKASTASVSGLLCMAIVGGAVLPWLSGHLADRTSIGMTFVLPAIAYVGIVLFAVLGPRSKLLGEEAVAAPGAIH
ncbi:MAG: major facilitator superfamily transporter [Sphingomonas bacterium]|uniref:glucose/galactose MFS transporter n=1 Tax=Sphingomonas bacterium TaxID=1895847 RepID=UPI00262E363D|nr:glucose/galactose MFS transporter [Sphingomonas bacterium]MDB5705119.1 major facilitator superfamily transporter [Sphingomonas bacterium]